MEHQTLEQSLRSGALDPRLTAVYGAEGLAAAKERFAAAAAGFTKTFESLPFVLSWAATTPTTSTAGSWPPPWIWTSWPPRLPTRAVCCASSPRATP